MPSMYARNLSFAGYTNRLNFYTFASYPRFLAPMNLPTTTTDSIRKAYLRHELYDRIDGTGGYSPKDFVRIHWFTHVPYMVDPDVYTGAQRCMQEYTITTTASGGKSARFASDTTLNAKRPECNKEITPQFLATLPAVIRGKIIEFVYREQLALTVAKEETIVAGAMSGANAKQQAASVFSGDLITQRNAQKQQSKTKLSDVAKETLNTVANTWKNVSGNATDQAKATAENLARDAVARKSALAAIKNSIATLKTTTPFGVAAAALNQTLSPLIAQLAGNVTKAISDSQGWECPSGFTEGSEFKADPVFTAVSDFFPNPITDVTNAALGSISCTRQNPDGTIQNTIKSRCIPNTIVTPPRFCYAPLPQRMVAATAPAVVATTCDADKDINRKLQMISDWITNMTLTTASVTEFGVVNNFTVVYSLADTLIECTFVMTKFSKTKATYNANKTGSKDEYVARFFFGKSGCAYNVIGFSTDTQNMFFFQKDYGLQTSFAPTPDTRVARIATAMANPSIADPVKEVLAGK